MPHPTLKHHPPVLNGEDQLVALLEPESAPQPSRKDDLSPPADLHYFDERLGHSNPIVRHRQRNCKALAQTRTPHWPWAGKKMGGASS